MPDRELLHHAVAGCRLRHRSNRTRRLVNGRSRESSQAAVVINADILDFLTIDILQAAGLRGQYQHLLADIPPGDNYLYYTAERGHPDPQFRWRSRFWSFLLKLDPDRPSPTIQAQPGSNVGPFHWDNRRLRLPEVRRLFTFPDSFEFAGSRNSAQYMLGNSVPPLLAQRVAQAVRDA